MHTRIYKSCRRILLVDVERLRTGSGRRFNGREGNPGRPQDESKSSSSRSCLEDPFSRYRNQNRNCTMGSLYGVARESLAGTPCLRWPLSSMRRPSQFCRFSEDKKQLACDIDIGFVIVKVFVLLFGDSALVRGSPSYEEHHTRPHLGHYI